MTTNTTIETNQVWRNDLGAELTIIGLASKYVHTLGDGSIWAAVSPLSVLGTTTYFVTAESLASARYELVGEAQR